MKVIKILIPVIILVIVVISISPIDVPFLRVSTQTPTVTPTATATHTIEPTQTAIPTATPTPTSTISEKFGIPDFYYDMPGEIPLGMDISDWFVENWESTYHSQEWDCSMMAAHIEYELENSGYHTKFMLGEYNGVRHAWVAVSLDDAWYIFDPIDLDFVDYSDSYKPFFILEDIYEVAELYNSDHIEEFQKEFAWWLR